MDFLQSGNLFYSKIYGPLSDCPKEDIEIETGSIDNPLEYFYSIRHECSNMELLSDFQKRVLNSKNGYIVADDVTKEWETQRLTWYGVYHSNRLNANFAIFCPWVTESYTYYEPFWFERKYDWGVRHSNVDGQYHIIGEYFWIKTFAETLPDTEQRPSWIYTMPHRLLEMLTPVDEIEPKSSSDMLLLMQAQSWRDKVARRNPPKGTTGFGTN